MTTPYRSDTDALRERKECLEAELAKLREQTTRLDALKAREAEIARELEGVEGKLRSGGPKRALPMLDDLRVASPCKASWDEMLGDARVRFCLSCEKNVYNLSSMTREEAEALLHERLGNELCVRFYRRADGTILTQDCPEGAKRKRRKKLAIAIAGAGAMAAAAVTAFGKTCRTQTMGAVAPQVIAQGQVTVVKPEQVMGEVAPTPSTMGSAVAPPVSPTSAPYGHDVRMGRPAIKR